LDDKRYDTDLVGLFFDTARNYTIGIPHCSATQEAINWDD
jgi:hypothetical protein